MYSSIVHPTDLSEASLPALKTAHDLAKSLGAELHVYFIAHPPLVASGDQLIDPETKETRDIPGEIHAIQPFDPQVNSSIKIVTIDENSEPKVLLELLEKMGCDLLVIGMHKRKGVKGWLKASITEDVVRHAHCDVLVARET